MYFAERPSDIVLVNVKLEKQEGFVGCSVLESEHQVVMISLSIPGHLSAQNFHFDSATVKHFLTDC